MGRKSINCTTLNGALKSWQFYYEKILNIPETKLKHVFLKEIFERLKDTNSLTKYRFNYI